MCKMEHTEANELICECGFKFNFKGFRNFDINIMDDGSKVIICVKCGARYTNI